MGDPGSKPVSASRLIVSICLLILALERQILAATDENAGTYPGDLEACKTDLTSFLPPPYQNMSYPSCMSVWNNFILRYYQSKDDLLTIVLSAEYTTGWVGIGFSRDGFMVGSSAMVGWFNKKGQAKVMQYYLQGTVPSQVMPGKGELPLSGVPAALALHGASIYLAFQLKLTKPLLRQPIILAFGFTYPKHHRLTHHDDKTTIIINFNAGSMSFAAKGMSSRKKSHGILGMLAWGLILPTGAIVARYFRHKDPLWYYLHTVIQLVGFIIGLGAAVLGVQLYNEFHPDIAAHRGIGIFILVLTILQVLAFFLRPNKDSKIRKYWNWYHNWFGRLALFFGAVNIVLGIQVGGAGSQWKIGYGFLVGTIMASVTVLEALLWMRSSGKADLSSAFQMNPVDQAPPSTFIKG
ncbi:cytochrome b561 and DOMON domain-containing protein At3g61750 [Punica granatum]|nr:cytochrome b561 and DOMON domain-containing protein At3g61750 [Punica granatum]